MKNFGNEIIKLKQLGLTHNEIKKKLGCSKTTISYHCKKNGLFFNNKINIPLNLMNEIQIKYNDGYSIRVLSKIYGYGREMLSKRIKNKRIQIIKSKEKRKKDISNNVMSWRKKKKKELVEYKGGKCLQCDYKKSIKAMEFHHIDPDKKDFTISGKSYSFKRLKKEVDKCILVCSNCHCEIHEGLLDIKKLIKKEEYRKQNQKYFI